MQTLVPTPIGSASTLAPDDTMVSTSISTTTTVIASTSATSASGEKLMVRFEDSWCMRLQSAAGATFQGAIIRTDDDADLCRDCAQLCFFELTNCKGFVLEPKYSDNAQFG